MVDSISKSKDELLKLAIKLVLEKKVAKVIRIITRFLLQISINDQEL